jgi:hypothetical protein
VAGVSEPIEVTPEFRSDVAEFLLSHLSGVEHVIVSESVNGIHWQPAQRTVTVGLISLATSADPSQLIGQIQKLVDEPVRKLGRPFNGARSGEIDWLKFEERIRAVLRTAQSYRDNPDADAYDLALLLSEISDALGEQTGRGYEIQSDWATARWRPAR